MLLLTAVAFTFPAVSESREADTDRDGLADGYELAVSGTEPQMLDTDRDGTADGFEVMYGADPLAKPTEARGFVEPTLPPGLPPRELPSPNASIGGDARPSPPPESADVYLSPAGSDGAGCTRSAPCRSMARGYARAGAGDLVLMAAGVYGRQSVPSGSKPVTFLGGPGVEVRQLWSSASNLTYDGITIDADFVPAQPGLQLSGANVTFRNASVGNVVDEKGLLVAGPNHTIDNVDFHDVVLQTPGIHLECAYAMDVPGLVLRNSTFRDCAVMDLFFTHRSWSCPCPGPYGAVTLENNVFGHPEQLNSRGWHSCCGLYIGSIGPNGAADPMSGWTVRNNTFETTALISPSSGSNGSRWVGNLGDWNCRPGIAYSHNVGRKCSMTDEQVDPSSSRRGAGADLGWADPGAHDFRLEPGSPAIDAADSEDFPLRDRYSLLRNGPPDAGAHEHAG